MKPYSVPNSEGLSKNDLSSRNRNFCVFNGNSPSWKNRVHIDIGIQMVLRDQGYSENKVHSCYLKNQQFFQHKYVDFF